MTSGGTESIMCALKTYRDRARDLYSIGEPGAFRLSVFLPRSPEPTAPFVPNTSLIHIFSSRPRLSLSYITEIVAPISVHVAFGKAAHLFDIKMVYIPLDPATMQPDMAAYAAAINSNTILLVGSAPQYPHGVVDPIEAIAALGATSVSGRVIPVHVDACIGGFVLPFIEKLGRPVPRVSHMQ